MASHQPHDHLFRHAFGRAEYAPEIVRGLLPRRLVERLDPERVKIVRGSSIDEALSDVVYSVPFVGGDEEAWAWMLSGTRRPRTRG